MTNHTKGLLATFEVGGNGNLALGSEDKTSLLTIVDEDGTDFAALYHADDAKRLAACWNFCDGNDTGGMETAIKIGETFSVMRDRWIAKELKLTAQRDRLLEALHAVEAVMNDSQGVAGWHRNGDIASWESVLPEVAEAHAFIKGEQP